MIKRNKRNKYGARATGGAGGFPSQLEAAVYGLLELREKNGEISELKRQQSFVLQDGPQNQRITWRIDFSFIEKGVLTFAEAKGFPDEVYKLKLKLWRAKKPHPLEIYEGRASNFSMTERIE